MKIVDATWERANLGVSCKELVCSETDTVEEVAHLLDGLSEDYLVGKIVTPRVDLLLLFQSRGFSVIETTLCLRKRLVGHSLPRLYSRYAADLTSREASGDDRAAVVAEVRRGVFATDRVSLDPRFSLAQAAARYEGWMAQELRGRSRAFITAFRGNDLGFSILRDDGDGRFNSLFGALYSGQKLSAMGFAVGWTNMLRAREMGGTSIETTVSSNNLAAIKMNLSIGYDVENLYYVAVKHRDEGCV